jgi:GMP synthase (glutamine-hydrolysing)
VKPLLIIQPATSYDDLPVLCASRGDELAWFSGASGVAPDRIRSVRVWQDEPLPDPREAAAVIVTGAIDMVTDGHAWIARTADWLRTAIAAETPVLGVCFGHQLLAHALGGTVGDNPRGAAFGAVEVSLTDAGRADPLFGVLPARSEMMVFHWQSVLAMPVGALATAAHDPFHAARFGPMAWGTQFHPEFDAAIMAGSYDVYAGAIERAGFDMAALRAANRDCPAGHALLRRFAAIAGF